jgi:release factor glutamine methyltransferase
MNGSYLTTKFKNNMTVGKFLDQATARLQKAGITTARLDCLVVLEDVTGHSRASLLAHPDTGLSPAQLASLNKFVTQREKHLPLAYYRSKAAFYGREFMVDHHVLVPRPESEAVINLLKKCALPASPRIADIGTGSGCLGLTAALELPGATVTLYDIDTRALEVAKRNAAKYELHNTRYKEQDLLSETHEPFDVILANLPYVPQDYHVNRAAQHEPKIALYSGPDGLSHYSRFWKQLKALDHKPLYVITESLPDQYHKLALLADQAGYTPEAKDGYVVSWRAQRQA